MPSRDEKGISALRSWWPVILVLAGIIIQWGVSLYVINEQGQDIGELKEQMSAVKEDVAVTKNDVAWIKTQFKSPTLSLENHDKPN